MKSIKNLQIAIIGGGPGGLTLARLLQMNGAEVKVYERDLDSHVRVQGATLDLHEGSGLAALKEAGLMSAFWSKYRPGADLVRIVNKHAQIIYDEGLTATKDFTRPEIDRGPLRDLLLDSLEPDTVIWDSNFQSLRRLEKGIELSFKNGSTAYADLVIAADGANSKIRPFITPIRPFYSGVTILEGKVQDSANLVPQIHKLLNGGKIFALDDSLSLIVSSKGDDSLVFYTGVNTPENWVSDSAIDFSDRQQVLNWFRQTFRDWDPAWEELVEKADLPFQPRPQYCMPLDQTWEALADITMLGDAAHLMPPYAGEGVNMAMLDALELSYCLLNPDFADTRTAIEAYETTMRARASETAAMTMEQTAVLHSPEAMAAMQEIFGITSARPAQE